MEEFYCPWHEGLAGKIETEKPFTPEQLKHIEASLGKPGSCRECIEYVAVHREHLNLIGDCSMYFRWGVRYHLPP